MNLRVRDVRLADGRIEVRGSKRGKGRNVPLAQSSVELLERWQERRAVGEWFFGTCCERGGLSSGAEVGGQLTTRYVQQMVGRYAKRACIERRVTPHTFRHTAATNWLDGGFTIREVQALLGHSDVSTTMIYTHVNDASLSAKMYAMDGVCMPELAAVVAT